MSNQGWLDQSLHRIASWHHYCLYVKTAFAQIPLTSEMLNQALDSHAQILKHDKTTTVANWQVDQDSYVLKRYNARSLGHTIKRAFRRSRARRCWQMSYHFQRAGLNVAAPMLMYEKRYGPIRRTAFFVSRHIAGEELLGALPNMSTADQLLVKEKLVEAFSLMREHKVSHGDMKASNLLWHQGTLIFIDLDAATKHLTRLTWLRSHRRDQARFLKNWYDQPELVKLFADLS